MLRPLLSVLLVKLADVGLGDQHLGQDLVSGRGPHEGSRVAVPVRDVVPDPADQCLHRCERAVADRLAGDDNAEPVLDTTDPPRPPTQSTTQAVKPNPSRPSVVRSVRNPGLSESSDDFLNRRSQFRRKMHIPG